MISKKNAKEIVIVLLSVPRRRHRLLFWLKSNLGPSEGNSSSRVSQWCWRLLHFLLEISFESAFFFHSEFLLSAALVSIFAFMTFFLFCEFNYFCCSQFVSSCQDRCWGFIANNHFYSSSLFWKKHSRLLLFSLAFRHLLFWSNSAVK